jgi:hypothetical protein
VKSLSELWKQKYARKRIEKLVREQRTNDSSLFYDTLIGISWDKAKEMYLDNVGR